MGIIRRQRLFLSRAAVLLLLFLVVFSGSPPCFAPVHTVSASSWDGIDTIAIIPSSDEFLDTAAQELKTYLEEMSGRSWTIVQGDTVDPAIRLDVNPSAPEFTDLNDEAVRIISDASGIRIIGKTPIATRHGAYTVHFEVSDGQLTDSEDVTITVVQLYEDWDVNGDGAANVLDMVLVGQHWGETGLTGWIREDASEDGTVNVLDMIIIGQHWIG